VPPQRAAWAIDAALLDVTAYSFEASLRWQSEQDADGRVLHRAEAVERFKMLPADHFPNTVRYARELNAGDGHERFDFALGLLFEGFIPVVS